MPGSSSVGFTPFRGSTGASPETMVIALGKTGDYLFDANDYIGAQEKYIACVETYDMYREGPAADAARSAFRIGEIVRFSYENMIVTPDNVQQKAQLKSEVENWYGKSLTYNVDVWFMASCVRAGELYEDFANAVAFMDPPPELPDEAIDEFYNQLFVQFYEPEVQKAINIYITAVEKAVSAGVRNEWVEQAADNLELLAPGTVSTLGLPGYEIEVYVPEPVDDTGTSGGEAVEQTGETVPDETVSGEEAGQ